MPAGGQLNLGHLGMESMAAGRRLGATADVPGHGVAGGSTLDLGAEHEPDPSVLAVIGRVAPVILVPVLWSVPFA